MRTFAGVLLFAALVAPAPPARGQQLRITTHDLANGMKILVHEDHDVPSVAMYFFYKIGSRNERPGTTGISHYFEHMMFNGARKFGPKQFDIQMEKAGGRNNAYTSRDVTVYTDWFPPSALELMFDMESDRIRDLSFDPKIVESERGVVYSERRNSVDNNPFGVLSEQLSAVSYIAHPYKFPVLGWPSDIESWTMDDLKAHFRMGYAPNNCVMVVTGDITHNQVVALAKKYLEPIPRQDAVPVVRTREPEQLGERRIEVRRPAALPIVMVSWHVPRTLDADTPALQALANILSSGRSSRLRKRLVETEQLALNVNANRGISLDPGQFNMTMQVRRGIEPRRAEAAAYEEIDKVARDGVTADEIAKARNQLLANFYQQMATIAGKANVIGNYEVFYGDHRKLLTAAEDLNRITAADVQRVAAKYLTQNNRTVGTLVPETPAAGGAK
jgi:zinc protease